MRVKNRRLDVYSDLGCGVEMITITQNMISWGFFIILLAFTVGIFSIIMYGFLIGEIHRYHLLPIVMIVLILTGCWIVLLSIPCSPFWSIRIDLFPANLITPEVCKAVGR